MSIFKLPDLGEGLVEAEIVEWHCKEGDQLTVDAVMVSLETAKAIVDIPSPETGVVVKRFGAVGDIIHTGDPLLEIDNQQSAAQGSEATAAVSSAASVVGVLPTNDASSSPHQPHRHRHHDAAMDMGHQGIKATPAVRALAASMNIDLAVVTPSGPHNTIKATDVERVANIFSEVGELQVLKGPRRAMAQAMTMAHKEVVSVTLHDDANISDWPMMSDITCRLIRALIQGCKAEPGLNAWYDSHAMGRRLIDDIHLGLAVDSRDGLFVPVIRKVQTIDARNLRKTIDTLKQQIKNRSIAAADLRGNTITLSNFGGIGGKYANPIIMPPTVAILGAGSSYASYRVEDEKLHEITLLPLSLSFDHRSITGAEAGRFLQAAIKDLQRSD